MTWLPKPTQTVETSHWTSSILHSVPLQSFSRLWDLGFQMRCKICSHPKRGLWATDQLFFSLAQVRRFWRCFLFRSGLTRGIRHLKPISQICLCVVALDALTPASVQSLWSSPTLLKGLLRTILSRLRSSLLLVHLFLPHFALPLNFLLMCFDTALCEHPTYFAITFWGFPSLWRVSMMVFCTTVRSAVFPMIVNPTEAGWETI